MALSGVTSTVMNPFEAAKTDVLNRASPDGHLTSAMMDHLNAVVGMTASGMEAKRGLVGTKALEQPHPRSNAEVKNATNFLLGGQALFAGDDKASMQDVIDLANGKPHTHNGKTYMVSPGEMQAARCLLDQYKFSGGKGKGSALDLILKGDDTFSRPEMTKIAGQLPAA